jgi:hypothetical protein
MVKARVLEVKSRQKIYHPYRNRSPARQVEYEGFHCSGWHRPYGLAPGDLMNRTTNPGKNQTKRNSELVIVGIILVAALIFAAFYFSIGRSTNGTTTISNTTSSSSSSVYSTPTQSTVFLVTAGPLSCTSSNGVCLVQITNNEYSGVQATGCSFSETSSPAATLSPNPASVPSRGSVNVECSSPNGHGSGVGAKFLGTIQFSDGTEAFWSGTWQ